MHGCVLFIVLIERLRLSWGLRIICMGTLRVGISQSRTELGLGLNADVPTDSLRLMTDA
jgi:hypothetical protein